MKKLSLAALLLFIGYCGMAQTATLTGNISDTTNNKQLMHTVVSLLRKADSVLVQFTRSGGDGRFTLKNIKPGDYLLFITHPTFGDYFDKLTIAGNDVTDLGRIALTPKSKLLQEVIVRSANGAIRLKGDTIEYRADSFKTSANANVEALLKKLPGIQVDRNGQITAQGEKVEKVLVDGEEFFGDDPVLATQNLRADAVDRVQVFDKKSDQAAFTGIDDGQKTKTINLQLKENKKKGYFGKLTLGGGLPGKFANEAMINAFKGKRKISAFGVMSNTGRTGLGWDDERNFGGGNNNMSAEVDDLTGSLNYSWNGGGDDFGGGWGGNFGGQGIPKSWSGGTHFSNKWNSDKNNVNGSIRFNRITTAGTGSTFTQNILPDTLFYNNQRSSNYTDRQGQRMNAFYEIQLDSMSSLKLSANGALGRNSSINTNFSEALDIAQRAVNRNNRSSNSVTNTQSFNSSAFWKKKFRKRGRTISVNLAQRYNHSESEGLLQSVIDFYNQTGSITRSDSIDQQKTGLSNTLVFDNRITYTEPITKKGYVEFSYGFTTNRSESKRSSFDKVGDKYSELNAQFSNDYAFRIITNTGGINYRYAEKKWNYSFGGSLAHTALRQTDLRSNTRLDYTYLNLFPRANFNYSFSQMRRLSLNYNGNTRQPSINQIQPIRANDDPLNEYLGNPDLDQEFTHNFRVNYNDYKVLTERSLWTGLNFSTTQNAISSKDSISSGKRYYQSVNVNGNFNASMYIGYGFKLGKSGVFFNSNSNLSMGRYVNFVNGKRNVNDRRSVNLGFGFSYTKEKVVEAYLSTGIGLNSNKSSIRPDVVTNFWSGNMNLDVEVELPGRFKLENTINAQIRQKVDAYDVNRNSVFWNASLVKKLLKQDKMELRFGINDILNQNIGFTRSANSNYITESNFDVIRRFWLLSATWHISKNAKAPQSDF